MAGSLLRFSNGSTATDAAVSTGIAAVVCAGRLGEGARELAHRGVPVAGLDRERGGHQLAPRAGDVVAHLAQQARRVGEGVGRSPRAA